ncbi:MAG: hypothetical protein WC262_12435 [Bacteroidales bacterium]|jgi:hypothetical protein
MVTWQQVIEQHGQELADRMVATGLLDGITCVRLPSGEADIPQCDIDRALRAAQGKPVFDWD